MSPAHQALSLHEEGGDDDQEDDQVDDVVRAGVPHHCLLDDPDQQRRRDDRRHFLHPADDGGGQRPEQHGETKGGADGQSDDAGPEDQGDGGEQPSDGPDDHVHSLHRNAQQGRPVGALGASPHRHTPVGPIEEPGQEDNGEGHRGHGQQVVALEAHLVEAERPVER